MIPAAAESQRAPDSSDATAAPAVIQADITSLVPATVTLATPLPATPIVSPTCPQVVSGSVRLETDLLCMDSDALRVGSDNTVIDLNGHRITCIGEPGGYSGSCQGPLPATLDDVGVDTNGFDNVQVFSHAPGGTINGFDIGVDVSADSDNVKVMQLKVTGPVGGPFGNFRPRTFGIRVAGDHCDGPVRIGGGTSTGNDVSNHTEGIRIAGASCVYVGYNTAHDNRDWGNLAFAAAGIRLSNSPTNLVRSNVVLLNGDNEPDPTLPDSGLLVNGASSAGNLLVENQVFRNRGSGITTSLGAATNEIVNNVMIFNSSPPDFADAWSDQSGVNRWNENNRCQTQTTPEPPGGVCNPGEVPPPS